MTRPNCEDQEEVVENDQLKAVSIQPSTSDRRDQIRTGNRFKYFCYNCLRRTLWLHPLLVVIILPLLCFSAYTYAIKTKQMKPLFPYISDTIALAPQAGISSLFLDLATILMLITGFIRYKQIKFYLTTQQIRSKVEEEFTSERKFLFRLHLYNFVSLLSMIIATGSLMGITNCRVTENGKLHFMFLFGFVIGISGYFGLMINVTMHLWSKYGLESRPVTMGLSFLVTAVFMVTMLTLTIVSAWLVGSDKFDNTQWRLNWTKDQPGYWVHVASTVTEWLGIVGGAMFLYACLCRRIHQFQHWPEVSFSR